MERISRRAFLGKTLRVTLGGGLIYHGVRLIQDEETPNYICNATQNLYDTAPTEAQKMYDQTTQSVLGKDFVTTYCELAPKAEITTGITFGTGIGLFRIIGFIGQSVIHRMQSNEETIE